MSQTIRANILEQEKNVDHSDFRLSREATLQRSSRPMS